MLDVLALRYSQLPQPALTAIFYAAVIAGAVFGALILPKPGYSLNRSTYFQQQCMALFGLALNQIWWLFYVPAVKAGVSGVFLFTDILGELACGAFLARIAVARSRDAYGDDSHAFYAFVPVMNLVLLFKPGQNAQPSGGFNAAMGIGIVLFLLARGVSTTLVAEVDRRSSAIANDPQAIAAMQAIQLRSSGIAAGLDALIAAEGAPAQLDANLRLAAVTRTDLHVTYDFILNDPQAQALANDYRRQVLSNFCGGLMRYLNLGATVSLHYARPDGAEIETVQLSLTACTT